MTDKFLIAILLVWITVLSIFLVDNRIKLTENIKSCEKDKEEMEAEMVRLDAKHTKELLIQEQLMTAIINGKEREW